MDALRSYNYILLAIVISFLAGCVGPRGKEVGGQAEIIQVKPIVDYNFLDGYTGDAKEGLFVIAGDVDAAWEKAKKLAIGEEGQVAEFITNEPLNFLVFRGVFATGGYGLEIERVERRGNSFSIHAIYSNPGPGSMVTQAFTQPAALIPIRFLETGKYEVKLFATVILKSESGDTVLEKGNEHASIDFKIS